MARQPPPQWIPHDFFSASITCTHLVVSWTIVYNNLWASSGLSLSLSLSWLSGNTEYSLSFCLSSLIACIGHFARYRFPFLMVYLLDFCTRKRGKKFQHSSPTDT